MATSGQVTKSARVRVARAIATAIRVAGKEEGKCSKGNGIGNKSGRQAAAMVTKRAMATSTRVAGK